MINDYELLRRPPKALWGTVWDVEGGMGKGHNHLGGEVGIDKCHSKLTSRTCSR